jgi:hypothetical protein
MKENRRHKSFPEFLAFHYCGKVILLFMNVVTKNILFVNEATCISWGFRMISLSRKTSDRYNKRFDVGK